MKAPAPRPSAGSRAGFGTRVAGLRRVPAGPVPDGEAREAVSAGEGAVAAGHRAAAAPAGNAARRRPGGERPGRRRLDRPPGFDPARGRRAGGHARPGTRAPAARGNLRAGCRRVRLSGLASREAEAGPKGGPLQGARSGIAPVGCPLEPPCEGQTALGGARDEGAREAGCGRSTLPPRRRARVSARRRPAGQASRRPLPAVRDRWKPGPGALRPSPSLRRASSLSDRQRPLAPCLRRACRKPSSPEHGIGSGLPGSRCGAIWPSARAVRRRRQATSRRREASRWSDHLRHAASRLRRACRRPSSAAHGTCDCVPGSRCGATGLSVRAARRRRQAASGRREGGAPVRPFASHGSSPPPCLPEASLPRARNRRGLPGSRRSATRPSARAACRRRQVVSGRREASARDRRALPAGRRSGRRPATA